MGLSFTARDVFEMGVQIEANGKNFYDAAAKKAQDPVSQQLFRDLAEWEAGHVSLFQRLRDEMPADGGELDFSDPSGESEDYLRATAESHVFMREVDVAGLVVECKDQFTILNLALTFEKDSIVFYTQMKKVVPAALGQERIDALISEEIKHIGMLIDRQKRLASR